MVLEYKKKNFKKSFKKIYFVFLKDILLVYQTKTNKLKLKT
jgi:hypothetical protein